MNSVSLASSSSSSGNRSRADSGSTVSSSDTSNRSKTSCRRRSHRPRGCRGGSSRKKRRNGVTNNNTKVPKEIGNKEGGNTNNYSFANSISAARRATETRLPTISDENAGGTAPPISNSNSSNMYVPLTSNAAVLYGGDSNVNILKPMKETKPCLPVPVKDAHLPQKENPFMQGSSNIMSRQILPPLQQSKVEEPPMLEGPNIYALQSIQNQNHSYNRNSLYLYNDCPATTNTNMDFLPHEQKQHHTYNNYHNIYDGDKPQQHHSSFSFASHRGLPVFHSENRETSIHDTKQKLNHNELTATATTTTTTTTNKAITRSDTYRNERIEKQRQMRSGGGSLFVTSPRSFLMGWKSHNEVRVQ